MDFIESKNNSLIKEVKKLKEKKFREEKNCFIVEGIRFTEEAINSNFEIEYIFFDEDSLQKKEVKKLLENRNSLLDNNTKVYKVTKEVFRIISNTETPQGVLAVVRNKEIHIKDNKGFYILVDRVQDPGNLGTIVRTAHATGALGVILTKGTVDIYNEKTLRSTMGSIFKVPIIRDDDLSFTFNLKDNGFKIISSSLDTDTNFYSLNLKENAIIVIGNEGNGISDEIYSISDIKAKLPMVGDSESLNAGVAAGIMMYEVLRQNTFEKF
ncbi:TrmH family RNA methyltransferase [Hathewaya histolytica]|uniref:TrmH family RNA methyltransferase n=1 Tax=Hathewaya histolytica TaxID=1498 RepID=UPI0010FF54A7|nr:RNA methyltransferase [Hathewaya histolytica]